MILRLPALALGAATLALTGFPLAAFAATPQDIPADTPISQILTLASSALSAGNSATALEYYDLAITRDPNNYLTLFRRGATYLSLGRSPQALSDFDKVLAIKPDFEGALVQRAKLRARNADWNGARTDYKAAGKATSTPKTEELQILEEAEGAAVLAREAAAAGQWEQCVTQASVALMTAGAALDLRQLRSKCRLEKSEIVEALSDLQHLISNSPGSKAAGEAALQIGAMYYYSLAESDKGIKAVAGCLKNDPDSKNCSKLLKRERKLDKELKKAKEAMEKRSFTKAVKILVPPTTATEEDGPGMIETIRQDFKDFAEAGYIHPKAPNGLLINVLEMTCESFLEMNNHKRATPYCTELHTLSPTSLPALLHLAQSELDAEDFEGSIRTLNSAKETHGTAHPMLSSLLQKAQIELKRSRTKDYYKVLGLTRDASEREIKKAYRKMSAINHPDKAKTPADRPAAEKKMASINEAYEVLSDPELKERFDRGDDPNDPEANMRGHGGPFQGHPFFHQGGGGQQQFFRSSQGGGGGGGFPGGFPGGGFPGGGGGGGGGSNFKFGG